MQGLHHKVGVNHAAAEEHGKQHAHKNELPPPELGFGQGVSHQRGEQQVDEGAHHGDINGDQHTPEQCIRRENIPVRGQ
ncbi:hypothetical protein D3C72_2356520 [compost metagenome]